MKTLTAFLFCVLATCALPPAHAGEDAAFAGLIYDPPPVGHTELAAHARFAALDQELKYLIFKRGDTSATHHFCIVGYRFADGEVEAVVLWREPGQLIRWSGHREPELAKAGFQYANSLFFSKALDLGTDLVDTPEEAGLSTFLTVRSRAEAVIADCERHGRQYVVEPFTPPAEED